MPVSRHCEKLLKQGHDYHVLYGDRLANHLPMVLIALDKIGADDQMLTSFYKSYSRLLVRLEKANLHKPVNPFDSIGNSTKFNHHLSYFKQKIKLSGIDQTLSESLPFLLPGISTSAFHALIRLAYAIESENSNEIAYGLSYWTSEHLPLGKLNSSIDRKP